MKIVILDGYTENPGDLSWKGFEQYGELDIYDRTAKADIVDRIRDAGIVYTNKTVITKETIAACPRMRMIGVLATGYNVVDVDAAREAGVLVTNIPDYGTDAVAQYTIALLLELCHHIGLHADCVKRGDWTNNRDWCFWNTPQMELSGKTLGIIGFGRIGQRTAQIAQALGMRILAYSRHPKREWESPTCKIASLDELLTRSDVISLHCPLLPATEGIINRDSIARMKDGVMILNASRGPLIVEADLRDALESGKVAGAACDVVSTEPIQMDNPLLSAKNCIITPHIAWAARESRQRLMDIALENLKAFMEGKPQNVVNG